MPESSKRGFDLVAKWGKIAEGQAGLNKAKTAGRGTRFCKGHGRPWQEGLWAIAGTGTRPVVYEGQSGGGC